MKYTLPLLSLLALSACGKGKEAAQQTALACACDIPHVCISINETTQSTFSGKATIASNTGIFLRGEPYRPYVIQLATPICIAEEPTVPPMAQIQLAGNVSRSFIYDHYERPVEATATFFANSTQFHITPVIANVQTMKGKN